MPLSDRAAIGILSNGLWFPPFPAAAGEAVKTQLLKAIELELQEIPEIGTVLRWQDIPVDLSDFTPPVLFFWEDEEKEPYNRLAQGTLDFWIEVFFPLAMDNEPDYTRFTEDADTVAGRLWNLFAGDLSSLKSAGLVKALPGRVVKAKHNPEWGVLFLTYQLTYVHNYGDAFAVN
jgi:hypothetical protein